VTSLAQLGIRYSLQAAGQEFARRLETRLQTASQAA
jgi:hypothetical protein